MPGSEIDMDAPAAPDSEPPSQPHVPRLAIVLGAIGRTLITTGIVVFLFVAYQLWGTGIQESKSQHSLSSELDQQFAFAARNAAAINAVAIDDTPVASVPPASADSNTVASTTTTSPPTTTTTSPTTTTSTLPGGYDPDLLALFFPDNGDALAHLEIPTIGVDKVVVRGVDVPDLRKGPGHYPSTVLPGNEGNAAIAGHRTTYGAPFNRIDELVPGDEITVTSVQGEFIYRVLDPSIAYAGYEEQIDSFGPGYIVVKPSATWVLGDFGDNRITLTACHPKLSARQRIIVTAELVGDPVHIPTWAEQAAAAAVAAAAARADSPGNGLGAPDVTTTASTGDQLVEAGPSTTVGFAVPTERAPQAGDLDRGLNGERGAIPGAILWMLGAMLFWIGAGYLGRHRTTWLPGRVAYRFAGLLPAAIFMWYSFQMIDRALPAY